MKILMVCLGNICRSPLAEGIMSRLIQEQGLDWQVDSAGTGSWHVGEPPDRRALQTAGSHGIDISHQRARQFQGEDIRTFDLILTMDTHVHQDVMLQTVDAGEQSKIDLVLNYLWPGENQSVPDPYYDDDGFEEVFGMLERACMEVIQKHSVKVSYK